MVLRESIDFSISNNDIASKFKEHSQDISFATLGENVDRERKVFTLLRYLQKQNAKTFFIYTFVRHLINKKNTNFVCKPILVKKVLPCYTYTKHKS